MKRRRINWNNSNMLWLWAKRKSTLMLTSFSGDNDYDYIELAFSVDLLNRALMRCYNFLNTHARAIGLLFHRIKFAQFCVILAYKKYV